jgi:xanthine dehydrogenase YagT iron-sulfur-binding subunit
MNIPITLVVNGHRRHVSVEPTEMLLDVLRDRLGYVGANKVCAQGICGACTVIVDGQAAS